MLAALLALVALPAVAVASGAVEADLVVAGPIEVEGAVRIGASDATVRLSPAPGADEVVTFHAPDGVLRIVRSERPAVDNPLAGDVWLAPRHETEVVPLRDARVTVRAPRPDFLAVLGASGDGVLAIEPRAGAHGLAPKAEGEAFVIGWREDPSYPYYYSREVPANSFWLAAPRGDEPRLQAQGVLHVALYGAELLVEDADGARAYQLGEWDDTTAGAAGVRAAYEHVSVFAVFAATDPLVALAPGTAADFYTRAPALDLLGRVALHGAAGAVRVPGAAAVARGETVELVGELRLRATRGAGEPGVLAEGPGEGESRVRVQGSADRAFVGGRELLATPMVEAAAAPLAALLALLLAWATGAGPKALALAAAPAYAGMTPEAMLDNDRRQLIYRTVLQNPGIHMRELHRLTGMRWGSLQYHAAVLLGMGMLRSARAGRRTVLACDAHGLGPEQIRGLHLLRGARARVVAQVVAQGQVTQRDAALRARVNPRLASRYLGMMVDLGLAEVVQGRPKRYLATPRMAELLPHVARANAVLAAVDAPSGPAARGPGPSGDLPRA